MKKSLYTLLLAFVLTVMCSAVALAYNPGQRTFHVLGQTLNSDKHPVHLVVTQTLDMRGILTKEAYDKLSDAQKKRVNRTEYNEANGVNAERITVTDGAGNIVKDSTSFVKDNYWYTIDHKHKTYDKIPALPSMSVPFAESLIPWFAARPEAGFDEVKGYDYDKMTKGASTMRFYFEKDTENWKAYEVDFMPIFNIVEVSNEVDEAVAFALPPADYKQFADQSMRAYANRLLHK